jgi:hypothetical protein
MIDLQGSPLSWPFFIAISILPGFAAGRAGKVDVLRLKPKPACSLSVVSYSAALLNL